MHYITVTESKTWLPLNHPTKRESRSSSRKDWECWIRKTKVILFYILLSFPATAIGTVKTGPNTAHLLRIKFKKKSVSPCWQIHLGLLYLSVSE